MKTERREKRNALKIEALKSALMSFMRAIDRWTKR